MLIKPNKLKAGDRIATVSPSWGGAGEPELRWRYDQGVRRLEDIFGLKVIPMPNSLKGGDYLYNNPKARAEDLMTAFRDESIKESLQILVETIVFVYFRILILML